MVSDFFLIGGVRCACHVLSAISFHGTMCVEAGEDLWGSLLHILYGSRKGKVTNERIVSGSVGTPMHVPSTVTRAYSGCVTLPGG